MENTSTNETLSSVKKHYYALAKEVQSIESRVMKLTEEDDKQRRKLENLKSRNHQFQDVKDEKSMREAEVLRGLCSYSATSKNTRRWWRCTRPRILRDAATTARL